MKLFLYSLSIEDCDVGEEGPENPTDFDLTLNAIIGEEKTGEYCSFSFRLCSPNRLVATENGVFINNTLVMHEFSWDAVRKRIEKLFVHVHACPDWKCIKDSFSGLLKYNFNY